jgi:uncharacterized protein
MQMMFPMYYETFKQFRKHLAQLDTCLEKASLYAKEKNFEPHLYLEFRLAPTQFPLVKQVRLTCDTAKLGISRLTGVEAPYQEDREHSIEELRVRIKEVLKYLDSFSRLEFDDTIDRTVTQPRWQGKFMNGHDYFMENVVPNFYFHFITAYSILRHNGVPLGKRDYLGELTFNRRTG